MSVRGVLLTAAMVGLTACETAVTASGSATSLVLQVAVADGLELMADQGVVRLDGPETRTVTIQPGSQRLVEDLDPGLYTVAFEALVAGEVEAFAERTGIRITAGETTEVSATLVGFVPVVNSWPGTLGEGEQATIQFQPVQGATQYLVEWDDNQGFISPQTEVTTATTVSIDMGSPDTYYVRVRARNRYGSTGMPSSSASVVVQANQPPGTPTIHAPEDGSVHTLGTSITFQGSASDPEDGDLTGPSLSWDSSLDGEIGTGTDFNRGDLSEGSHSITLTATDSRGRASTSSISITVENLPPEVVIASPSDGASYGEGATIVFEGSAVDDKDGILTGGSLVWTSSIEGQIGTGATFSRSDLSLGSHTITLSATDSDLLTGTDEVTITVTGGPQVEIVSPADGATFAAGASIPFQGSAVDGEDGELTGDDLAWRSDVDGTIGSGTSFSRSDLSVGAHTITLTATDSDGSEGSASVGITVENQPPEVTISNPGDGATFLLGNSVGFQGAATDPEDGALTGSDLVWTSSLDGPIGMGTSFVRSDLSLGTHVITLSATDSEGLEETAAVSITILGPPTANIALPSDGATFEEGADITFQGSAEDPEDGALDGSSLVWTSNLNGSIGTGTSFTRSDLSVGSHTVTLIATDSDGLTASASVSITVEGEDPTRIIGMVSASGHALEGATVMIDGPMTQSTLTVADGSYLFDAIAPGSYVVSLTDFPANYSFETLQSPVNVSEGETATVDFEGTLVETPEITIEEISQDGTPVPDLNNLDGTVEVAVSVRPRGSTLSRLDLMIQDPSTGELYLVSSQPFAAGSTAPRKTHDTEQVDVVFSWETDVTRGLDGSHPTIQRSDGLGSPFEPIPTDPSRPYHPLFVNGDWTIWARVLSVESDPASDVLSVMTTNVDAANLGVTSDNTNWNDPTTGEPFPSLLIESTMGLRWLSGDVHVTVYPVIYSAPYDPNNPLIQSAALAFDGFVGGADFTFGGAPLTSPGSDGTFRFTYCELPGGTAQNGAPCYASIQGVNTGFIGARNVNLMTETVFGGAGPGLPPRLITLFGTQLGSEVDIRDVLRIDNEAPVSGSDDPNTYPGDYTDPHGNEVTEGTPIEGIGLPQGTTDWDRFGNFTEGALNEAPEVSIEVPTSGQVHQTGTLASFEGSSNDPEDGTLSGSSLIWTSNLDGPIGTGTSFTRSDLSEGSHVIVLTATDSEGKEGADTVVTHVSSADLRLDGSPFRQYPLIPSNLTELVADLQGEGTVGNFRFQFWLSTTPDLSGSTYLVFDQMLDGYGGFVQPGLQVPPEMDGGAYYIIAVLDADDDVIEFDETNNVVPSSEAYTVHKEIDFETYPDGSATCNQCPIEGDFVDAGVSFSFSSSGTSDTRGWIDRPAPFQKSGDPDPPKVLWGEPDPQKLGTLFLDFFPFYEAPTMVTIEVLHGAGFVPTIDATARYGGSTIVPTVTVLEVYENPGGFEIQRTRISLVDSNTVGTVALGDASDQASANVVLIRYGS